MFTQAKKLFTLILSKSIAREFSWYFFGTAISQLLSLLSVFFVYRYLGPINLGLYSFVQNYLVFFGVAVGGMDTYFFWSLARATDKKQKTIEYFFHKGRVVFFAAFVGSLCASIVLPHDVAILATSTFIFWFLQSVSTVFYHYANLTKRAKLYSIAQTVSAFISFSAKVVCVYTHAPLSFFLAATVFDSLGLIVFVYLLVHHDITFSDFKKQYSGIRETMLYVWRSKLSLVSVTCITLITKVDQLILATITNAYHLGIYAGAVKIVETPLFLTAVLFAAIAPYMDSLSGVEKKRERVLFLLSFLGTGIFAMLFIVLFSSPIIHFLYGDRFIESKGVLFVYAFSLPANFVMYYFYHVYQNQKREIEGSLILFFGMIINVALVYILTPLYSLSGTAAATVIAYSVIACVLYIRAEKIYGK